jgi:hypothetical protein
MQKLYKYLISTGSYATSFLNLNFIFNSNRRPGAYPRKVNKPGAYKRQVNDWTTVVAISN